jgi:hypothetical protein
MWNSAVLNDALELLAQGGTYWCLIPRTAESHIVKREVAR